MLPKVATHILHHTSRAAAAVQNQTSATIRNVLQLQSSSGSSNSAGGISWNGAASSSSSWGSNGTGPGGAKYHAGSRFYHGYTGAGRAVTQANTSASHDGSSGQSDDTEDLTQKRASFHAPRRTRMRSHSLSIGGGRQERGEKLGVLETVQMHVRSKHAFVPSPLDTLSPADEPMGGLVPAHSNSNSRPALVRRNSTSASVSPGGVDQSSLPLPQSSPVPTSFFTDPASPQSITPPPQPDENFRVSSAFKALKLAKDSKDPMRVMQEVSNFRSTAPDPQIGEFNMALEALHETRKPGDSLTAILETYNDMLQRSITPDARTYILLIHSLTDRDREAQRFIASLESRRKRRALTAPSETVQQAADEQQILQLRAEHNFVSAMSLFDAAISLNANRRIPLSIYSNLIKCCALHANVEGAIHVFARLERRPDLLPTAAIFKDMMSAYIKLGDIQGAEEVFSEFKSASQSGRVGWNTTKDVFVPGVDQGDIQLGYLQARSAQVAVWNKMIEAYFHVGKPERGTDILGHMMDHGVTGTEFDPSGVPAPAPSTYDTIITGFCQSGDVKTALTWFDQLLAQGVEVARLPLETRAVPFKPDQRAWIVMLESLAHEGMVDDLNRIFAILKTTAGAEGLEIRAIDRITLFAANMRHLDNRPASNDVLDVLDFLQEHVLCQDDASDASPFLMHGGMRTVVEQLVHQYMKHGASQKALDLTEREVKAALASIQYNEEEMDESTGDVVHKKMTEARKLVLSVIRNVLQHQLETRQLTLKNAMRIAHLSDSVGLSPRRVVAKYYLHAYTQARVAGENVTLTDHEWQLLLYASTSMELPQAASETLEVPDIPGFTFNGGTKSLLIDMRNSSVSLDKINPAIIKRIVKAVVFRSNVDQLQALYEKLGPAYERILNNPERDAQYIRESAQRPQDLTTGDTLSTEDIPVVAIDTAHSRFVDEHFPPNPKVSPLVAYTRFQAAASKHIYPTPVTLARLITTLGRMGEVTKVRSLYDAAQLILASLQNEKQRQSQAWFQIEDSMICAYAHAGDVDSAHVHRVRILEQGGAPSADSYGALIHSVKDTTDDTSNAMALFQESQARGITPSIYLYNTIISKLAKARKADFALELFQQMKATGFRPSSITFGAVIAACARVGDTYSAERLFTEMTSQSNFRPRIPPYNTMMQMYIVTKPDRERALYYFDALLKANIEPSAHTYKLLIDAYGTIEPIDVAAMEDVFTRLQNDKKVQTQGTHWAALIHAYGCVKKDLEKALEIFDSVVSHPSTVHSHATLPDAVTYESIINVLVTHRRTDLIPKYIARLKASDVHMTAYIVNFMIKGHAIVGDIEQARSIFESLSDPPEGVAAPNNHVSHEGIQAPLAAPVYREPSTWEAMVRAELGNGHRDRAVALLDRLQARKFPSAVYNRISGIMLDDNVSPWSSDRSVSSFDSASFGHGYS